MNEQCVFANFIQKKDVSDLLDKYVVLAFVLTLILTILIVILLTKYISYYIQKQREIEAEIKVRKSLRLPRSRANDENSESSSDFVWSDSEEEEVVDIKASVETLKEFESDINPDFETNYVDKILEENVSEAKLNNGKEDSYDSYLIRLQPTHPFSDHSNVSTFKYLFSDSTNHTSCIQRSNALQENLNYVICFRQNAFQSLCSFILDSFCKSHIISEDLRMFLESKYDQKIDECISGDNINQVLHVSHIVQDMTQEFVDDLKKYNGSNQKQTQNLQNLLQCFFTLHLDCIKILASDLPNFAELNTIYEASICELSIDIRKVMMMGKYRILILKNAIADMKNDSEVGQFVDSYNGKVIFMLENLERDFKKTVHSTLIKLDRIRSEELTKLRLRYNIEVSNLKVEALGMKGSVEEKLKLFQTYLISLFTSHLEERYNLFIQLDEYESKEIKQMFLKFQKRFTNEMSHLEEDLFASLNEHCNFTEENILSIAQDVQQKLQNTKEQYLNIKNEFLQISSQTIKKQSKTISTFIGYLIKVVSSEFKFLTNSVNDSLKFMPSIQTDVLEDILISIKQKLSIAVFDLIASISVNLNATAFIRNTTESPKLISENIFSAIKSQISNHVSVISEESIQTDVLNSFQYVYQVNEINIEELFLKYMIVILHTMHEKVLGSFEKNVDENLIQSILTHQEQHFDVYENVKEFLLSAKNIHSVESESDRKYMSRKGSSFKQKCKDKELEDEYESHLSMKGNKVNECYKKVEENNLKNTFKQKNNKAQSVNQSCINILQSEVESFSQENAEYLQNLFQLEHYYMIERFLKKVAVLAEDGKVYQEEESRKMKNTSQKSVRTSSPRSVSSNSNKERKKQSKLMSVLKQDGADRKENNKKGKHSSGKNAVEPVDVSPRKNIYKKSISAMKATVSPEPLVKTKSGKKM